MILAIHLPYASQWTTDRPYRLGVSVTCDGDPQCMAGMYFYDCGITMAANRLTTIGWITTGKFGLGNQFCPDHAAPVCQSPVLGSATSAGSVLASQPADHKPPEQTPISTPEVTR